MNRIASTQALRFEPGGITVVYGDNASGKSGYARVLKCACRARDVDEVVYPDAFAAGAEGLVPEASLDVLVGGQAHTILWKRGEAPPDTLSSISVFDGRCARVYVDSERDVAYMPYGLDLIENLAHVVLPRLSLMLEREIATTNTDPSAFNDLRGATEVGKLIAALGPDTHEESVKRLATVRDTEQARLAQLEEALRENDPRTRAAELRRSASRMSTLTQRIDTAVAVVDDTAVAKLKVTAEQAWDATRAEAIAADGFRAGEALLAGTGDEVWKQLFDAARRFSTESAYPGQAFPYIDADAKCLLCQQPLVEQAAVRMCRFQEFVSRDAARTAAIRRAQIARDLQTVRTASLSFGLDTATREEVAQLNDGLLDALLVFEKALEERRQSLAKAAEGPSWGALPALEGDPRPLLADTSSSLVKQAEANEAAADENQRAILEAERAELRTRVGLASRLQSVLDLIGRMRMKRKLESCLADLNTKGISDKAKEFASKSVTATLRDMLNAEIGALGMGHLRVKLVERVERGSTRHKLVLDIAKPSKQKLSEILSEGEQRALAIASFFAELSLAGHKGGIVFDDPVSSLDHHRRTHVAHRLVAESKDRQVVVFTHDTVFLGEIRGAIEQTGVGNRICHLEWASGRPGNVCESLPWEHQSYKERLDCLDKGQSALSRAWSPYPNESQRSQMRDQYDLLRATIERVVQDIVFNGVIDRYRDWMKVGKLQGVAGFTPDECSEIMRLHKKCSDVVKAHDHSSSKNSPVPDPTQLAQDIAGLRAVIQSILARRP